MKEKMLSRIFVAGLMAAAVSFALSACSTVSSSGLRRTSETGSPNGVIATMPPAVERELKAQFDEYIRWKGPLKAAEAISEFPADVAQSSRWKQFAGGDLSGTYWVIYEVCIPGAHPEAGLVETFLMPEAVAQISPIGQLRVFRYHENKQTNQALQHNDPSCHESCLRTPRASRGRG